MINRQILAYAAGAALIAGAAVTTEPTGPNVIRNRGNDALPRDALRAVDPTRARKQRARAAAQELVAVSNATLVVAHLHPRWLRQAVEVCMDDGAHVDAAFIERLRALGPEGVMATIGLWSAVHE